VTTTAANVLGDSSKFPADWLFSYRWGKSRTKGKKGQGENNVLPNGEKITHITVGGRTSAVVESRQKKIKGGGEEDEKPAKKGKKANDEETEMAEKKTKRKSIAKAEDPVEETTPKKRRVSGKQSANGSVKNTPTPTRKSSRAKA
jgi:formamidopyrimidine-DNA glycosylase